jgi:myosin heavy subunit
MNTQEVIAKLNKYKEMLDQESDADIKARYKSKISQLEDSLKESEQKVEKLEQKVAAEEQKELSEVEKKIKKYQDFLSSESDPDIKARYQKKIKELQDSLNEVKVEIKEEKKEIAEQKAEIKKAVKAVKSVKATKVEKKEAVKKVEKKVRERKQVTEKRTRRGKKIKKIMSDLDRLIEGNKKLKAKYTGKGVDLKKDAARSAKPFGYRFVGKHDYRVPTKAQIKSGKASGKVVYEGRANRSDVYPKRAVKLAKGGQFAHGGMTDSEYTRKLDKVVDYYLDNDVYDDPESYGLEEKDLGNLKKVEDAIIRKYELHLADNLQERFEDLGFVDIKHYNDDDYEYKKGGLTKGKYYLVYRDRSKSWDKDIKYFDSSEELEKWSKENFDSKKILPTKSGVVDKSMSESDLIEYKKGGKTPVIRTQFEEEEFEYGHGGHTQGYDDREDERLAMKHGRIGSKDLHSTHARRDDARFEERGKMAKGGRVDFGSLYEKIIKAVQKDLKISKEDATKLVDEKETFIVDLIEHEEIKSPIRIADIITSDYGEFHAKGGRVGHSYEDKVRFAKPAGWRWKNTAVKKKIITSAQLSKSPSKAMREKYPNYVYFENRLNKADKKPSRKYLSE